MSEPDRRKPTALTAYQLTGIAPLSSFPISLGDFRELTTRLRLVEKESLQLLFLYVYQHGEPLPGDGDELASLAGVGRSRWIDMAPHLAPFFVINDEGWSHPGLEEAHHRYFQAQEDDRLYRERARVFGATGAARRKLQQAAKTAKQQREAEREARAAEAGALPDGFADTLDAGKGQPRVGLGYPSQTLAENELYPTVSPLGSGVASRGLNDCPEGLPEEDKSAVIQSVKAVSGIEVGARDTYAINPGRVKRADPSETLTVADPDRDRGRQSDPCPTLADRAVPSCPADVPLGDDELTQSIIRAGGNGLATNWPRRRTLLDIRAACAKGLDLRLDVLPEISAFAEGVLKGAKGLLMHPANKEIIAAAWERRQRRLNEPAQVARQLSEVDVDAPENQVAWRLYLNAKGKKSLPTEHRNGGKLARVERQLWADCQQRAGDKPSEGVPHERLVDGGCGRVLVAGGLPP